MTETVAQPSLPRSLVIALVTVVTMTVLGVAHLLWLDRADQVGSMFGSAIGPIVGVFVGVWLSARIRPDRRVRRHSLAFFAAVGFVTFCLWLLVVSAFTGGIDSDVPVPALVLGLAGAGVVAATSKVVTPEQVL